MQNGYPAVFLIFGNDDGRWGEPAVLEGAAVQGFWHYIPNHKMSWQGHHVYGYAYVPPTPFRLKDWDRFDVSQYVDLGCLSPAEGFYSVSRCLTTRSASQPSRKDLERLTAGEESGKCDIPLSYSAVSRHVWIAFHRTRARSTAFRFWIRMRGSIAVKRLIETRQPARDSSWAYHESARISGSWQERIGRRPAPLQRLMTAPELALVRGSTGTSPGNTPARTGFEKTESRPSGVINYLLI